MLTLGALTFLSPAVLLAGVVLPVIWLLLRLTPPAVRRIDFPAVRLLFNLPPTERTSARTPLWLVILRLGLLTLALLGLADPILTAHRDDTTGPMVVVVDDGWASAVQWQARQKAMRNLLERADRHDRPVALLTTAPTATPGPALRLGPARDALARSATIQPLPWPTDRKAAAEQLQGLDIGEGAEAFWIADGVASNGDADFNRALTHVGPVTILRADPVDAPLVLGSPQRDADNPNQIALPVRRIAPDDTPSSTAAVRALDRDDHVLARTVVNLARGDNFARAVLEAPPELSNRLVRFDVEEQQSAGATVLADSRWQRRPVGIASANANGIAAPLLEDAYYIRQALVQDADVREGDLDTLLSRPLAVLFMASGGRLLDPEVEKLSRWIDGGGVLVRFAGPRLNDNVDRLLPVHLRIGGRSFGGALSWDEPAHMAPFPDNSPFKTMAVPDDVTVASQVLAEPTPDLPDKTWARLSDGTPLITATRRGQGWLILFHVTATPEWSNLPLSGLFVEILHRIVDLSAGVAADDATAGTGDLPALQMLDGRGHLVPPDTTGRALPLKPAHPITVGPDMPPGLYGTTGNSTALNLSPSLANAQPVATWPPGGRAVALNGLAAEHPLKPYFLTAALVLLLLDLAISFFLRGLPLPNLRWLRNVTGALLVLALFIGSARAADRAPIDSDITAAVLDTRLAYVATGNTTIDRMTEAGLISLTNVLAARTSAEMAKPAAVDLSAASISADRLTPYPFIYWRVAPGEAAPNPKAAAALNTYFHRGGMVVFDAPEQSGAVGGKGAGERLDAILRTLDLPALVQVADDHVLTRSFYLLKGLPGRYTDTPVYVDKGTTATDGVASIIVGGNDWVAAWARDSNGVPLYPAVPGGENQREMAYRTGVNMVMYALTGNYKSDQVHLPAIMQRLTQ